jgi:glycosyltransferase involved in cell wall biosynthesis
MVVVICSYNNEKYYEWNLASVFAQEYKNYHVLYVNDCSADNTGSGVVDYAKKKGMQDKLIIYHNEERRRALANLYYAINTCNPTDIIIILDGDDRFAHAQVLQRINQAYEDPNIWLTYGQFRECPSGGLGFCRPYPKRVIERCGFRYHADTPSHLRTFYAGLFHKIRKDDLMFQGDFFPVTYDLAIMFPMIEMASLHHLFIPDVLVDYNGGNPINDHKGDGKRLQRKFDLIIRARTCYTEIESPF